MTPNKLAVYVVADMVLADTVVADIDFPRGPCGFFAVADMVAPRVFGLSSTYRHSAAAQMYFTTVAVYFLILFVLSRIGVARRARHDDDCENKVPVGNHFTCQCCFFLLTVYFCCCNPLSFSFHSIELKFALEDDDLTRKEP